MMAGTSTKETQNATANALSIGLAKADATKPGNEDSADNVGNNASAASAGFDPSAGNEF
jgi:hypothetical protein